MATALVGGPMYLVEQGDGSATSSSMEEALCPNRQGWATSEC